MSPSRFAGAPLYVFEVEHDYRFNAQQSITLINTLLSMGTFAMQIVARSTGIRWQVIDLSGGGTRLNTLKLHHVDVKSQAYNPASQRRFPFFRAKLSFNTATAANRPILYITDLRADGDPLLQVAQTISYLEEHEEVRYTILVNREYKPPIYQGLSLTNDLVNLGRDDRTIGRYEQTLNHKTAQPWYETLVLLDVDSPSFQRALHLRQALSYQISGGFDRHVTHEPLNGLRSRRFSSIFKVENAQQAYQTSTLGWYERSDHNKKVADWWREHWLYFETPELATLWHLPHNRFEGTSVRWATKLPNVPQSMLKDGDLRLGEGIYRGQRVPAFLNLPDRETHTTVFGRTGTGKSTLMHDQIHQDILAGRGVGVIDPHGSLVSNILRTSIPVEREEDVVVLDLGQPDYPIPLNLFAGIQSYAAVGRVVDIIAQMYSHTGVQIDRYLRNGIQALQHVPDATMKDLYYLFADAQFRSGIISKITNDVILHTLREGYHQQTPATQHKISAPVLNRIRPFYDNPYLYPSLCHPHRIDLERWIREKKIVLISLRVNSEEVPQPERNLVGSLLVSLFQMIGMSQTTAQSPFYVYIDEVQHFVSSSLDIVFSEARKYGLYMTVAHQFLEQLDENILQSILGNVGTMIMFRSNNDDANRLAASTAPDFTASDLTNLDLYQAAVKTQVDGRTQRAFLLYSPSPHRQSAGAEFREAYLRHKSIENYTPLSRAEVLTWLNNRYSSFAPPDLRSTDSIDVTMMMMMDSLVKEVVARR